MLQSRVRTTFSVLSSVTGWGLAVASVGASFSLIGSGQVKMPVAILGPGLTLVFLLLHVLRPAIVSVWIGALWAILGLSVLVAQAADGSTATVFGLLPERFLVVLLGVLYLVAGFHIARSHLLGRTMRIVLLGLGVWAFSAIPGALFNQLGLWDLLLWRGSPHWLPPAASPFEPTFVGINAFLICALSVAFFDTFCRALDRDIRHGAVFALLFVLIFLSLRFLLDRYEQRHMPSFRTMVREAVKMRP